MIYEIASLPVKTDRTDSFVQAFDKVAHLLTRAEGYRGHLLMQGMETPAHFNLIVRWRTLEDHTKGFEPSADHEEFMRGVQEYFAAEPVVYHIQAASSKNENDFFSV